MKGTCMAQCAPSPKIYIYLLLFCFTSECRVLALDVVCEVLVLDVVPAANHKHDGVVKGRLKAWKVIKVQKTETFFVATNSTKFFSFLNRSRIKFVLFTQNKSFISQKYGLGIRDPEKPIPDPGVKKGTGSRIRNTGTNLLSSLVPLFWALSRCPHAGSWGPGTWTES